MIIQIKNCCKINKNNKGQIKLIMQLFHTAKIIYKCTQNEEMKKTGIIKFLRSDLKSMTFIRFAIGLEHHCMIRFLGRVSSVQSILFSFVMTVFKNRNITMGIFMDWIVMNNICGIPEKVFVTLVEQNNPDADKNNWTNTWPSKNRMNDCATKSTSSNTQ